MLPYLNSMVKFSATMSLYVSLNYTWGHPCMFCSPNLSRSSAGTDRFQLSKRYSTQLSGYQNVTKFLDPTQRNPIHINYYLKFITLLGDHPARIPCQLWPWADGCLRNGQHRTIEISAQEQCVHISQRPCFRERQEI